MSWAISGTIFASTYACMFMNENQSKPFYDFGNVSFIWTHGKEKLKTFLNNFNNYDPKRKYFFSESLGLLVRRSFDHRHIKFIDEHQYLQFISADTDHTKRSIVFSQALRVSGICSFEKYFANYIQNMKSWFYARDYPKHLVQKKMKKVRGTQM